MSVADSHWSAHKTKILIVEDDDDQLTLRTILLEGHGFSCATAATVVAAKRAFSADASDGGPPEGGLPECVLMDLRLPAESDGVQFIQWLDSLPRPPAIVILTGSRIARLRTRAALKKVAAFLEKGSPTCDLLATLKRVCGTPEGRE